jgi:hypothetical protein
MVRLFVTVLGALILSGALLSCKDEKNPVQQYGDTLVHGYKSAQKVEKDANLQQVQRQVYEFQAAQGRYPADLRELGEFTRSPIDENKYNYDPMTGSVTAK